MFIEPHIGQTFKHVTAGHGWIEVICGSMFSGKTEELIRRLNRALIAQQKVEIFKPEVDTRHKSERVISHNENSIRSTTVEFARDILLSSNSCDVVGIDEVQFFDDEIVTICRDLANQGKRVIVAGLDMDFQGQPFGSIPILMAIAEYVTKLHAICVQCGGIASFSFRLNPEREQVVVGEKNIYEARCRECFSKGDTFND